jgi:hypothetical protein
MNINAVTLLGYPCACRQNKSLLNVYGHTLAAVQRAGDVNKTHFPRRPIIPIDQPSIILDFRDRPVITIDINRLDLFRLEMSLISTFQSHRIKFISRGLLCIITCTIGIFPGFHIEITHDHIILIQVNLVWVLDIIQAHIPPTKILIIYPFFHHKYHKFLRFNIASDAPVMIPREYWA